MSRFPLLVWLVLVAAVALVAVVRSTGFLSTMNCREMTEGMRAMHTEEVSLVNDRGQVVVLQTHVADDNAERAAGYQYICANVIDSSSILFAWPRPISARFHMRNVEAPLDIGFFDSRGELFSVMRMQPGDDKDSRLYGPSKPFQYALEAGQGFFAAQSLSAEKSRLIIGKLYDSR